MWETFLELRKKMKVIGGVDKLAELHQKVRQLQLLVIKLNKTSK